MKKKPEFTPKQLQVLENLPFSWDHLKPIHAICGRAGSALKVLEKRSLVIIRYSRMCYDESGATDSGNAAILRAHPERRAEYFEGAVTEAEKVLELAKQVALAAARDSFDRRLRWQSRMEDLGALRRAQAEEEESDARKSN